MNGHLLFVKQHFANHKNNPLTTIFDSQGVIISDPGQIRTVDLYLRRQTKFISRLFFSTLLSCQTPYSRVLSAFLEKNGHKVKFVYFSTYNIQVRFELAKNFAKFSRESGFIYCIESLR